MYELSDRDGCCKMLTSAHNMAAGPLKYQQLWLSAQDLYMITPVKFPA